MKEPLSCERIVTHAVDLVDAGCLPDLSMRRLGARLGVEAMSLYRYFPNKAALLDALIDRLLGDLELPGPGDTDWEAGVRAYSRSFRALASRHPQLLALLATVGPRNRALRDAADRMEALYRRAGVDAEVARRTQAAVQALVTGSSLWEVTPDRGAASTSDEDFDFALDVLIAGLLPRLGWPVYPPGSAGSRERNASTSAASGSTVS